MRVGHYLLLLKSNEHVEATFRLGLRNLSLLETSQNPEQTIEFAERALKKAPELGKIKARFFLF